MDASKAEKQHHTITHLLPCFTDEIIFWCCFSTVDFCQEVKYKSANFILTEGFETKPGIITGVFLA